MSNTNSFFCSDEYKGLNKYQKKVVTTKRKHALVLASAGTGKTFVIKMRIKYLINVLNIKPKEILCISFTNDTVNKLKSDLKEYDVDIMTFHKLGLNIIGSSKEVLTEDMLFDIILDTFNNEKLLGLYNMYKSELCTLIYTFINLFKSNNYKLNDFYKMIKKSEYKEKELLKEIMKCYICYESYLKKENIIDFSDMINLAIKKMDNKTLNYKYIIIDEYQDTSLSKFELINKIRLKTNASFLAVGDDFQSIYRFTGSNLDIITKIKKYIPFCKIYTLKYTYRNSKELIKIASKFICKNPVQIRKKMISNISIKNPVEIIYYEDLEIKMKSIIEKYNLNDVLILSRNNKDLENTKLNYDKMTVHRSKGLEKDYVFLINVNNNKNGFPNKYVDNKILRFVNKYKIYYPYDEERRLFYVALTRCKKKIFIFVPLKNESIFVKELLKMKNVVVNKY